jgi:predicted metal-dependent HD superfamily phosphohydrolase
VTATAASSPTPTSRSWPYAEYVADVRGEYAHVPDVLFATGRAAVLRDLLAKPTLFHTAHARAHWEPAARANVEAELDELAQV